MELCDDDDVKRNVVEKHRMKQHVGWRELRGASFSNLENVIRELVRFSQPVILFLDCTRIVLR